MSQDMMQALSGSSLLSLSVGTLPAVKGGMNLDANPFASQLALMTGTDAAVAGLAMPVAVVQGTGEGAFAVTMEGVADSARVAPQTVAVAAPAAPEAARLPVAPDAPIVAALPEEASTLQLIEAALTGAATVNQVPRAPEMPQVASRSSLPTAEAEPAALPEQQEAQPALTVQPLPHAANVPHLRNLIRADAPMPIRAALSDEADAADAESVGSDAAPPRIRMPGAEMASPVEAMIVPPAPVVIAPLPVPTQRPDAPATDMGSTRILAEATPVAPRQAGPAPVVAAPIQTSSPAPIQTSIPTPIRTPVPALASGQAPAAQNVAPAIDAPLPVDSGLSPISTEARPDRRNREAGVATELNQPITLASATFAPAAPVAAQTSFAQTLPPAPTMRPAAGIVSAISRDQSRPASVRTTDLESAGAPLDSASAVDLSAIAETGPIAQPAPQQPLNETRGQASAQPQGHAQVQQQSASTEAADAAEAAMGAMTAATRTPAATPGARPAAPAATRAPISATARRTVDTAIQSARAADVLPAQFDLADPTLQPAASSLNVDQGAGPSIEAVPPAWAAALNAVNPQVQQPGTIAAAQGAGPAQVPMHSLAFDAGFVAGIESQIAKLADGGQMVKIQVMPEHLGRIDIEMLAGPDRDQVRIVTEHDAVRDTLINSQHRLEQDLRNNGQRNAEVTVELRQQSPGAQNGSAQQQQQRGQSGAESVSAREAALRQAPADTAADAAPVQRRPRGNVRYA